PFSRLTAIPSSCPVTPDTATPESHTLSLHDALPIYLVGDQVQRSTKLKNVELLVCLLYINRSNSRLVILGLVATPKSTSTTGGARLVLPGRTSVGTDGGMALRGLHCRQFLELPNDPLASTNG